MGIFVRSCIFMAWIFFLGVKAQAADAPGCPPLAKAFSAELFEDAARQPRNRGPLWRITKDGHSSYLYGTIHVGKAHWIAPGPLVKRALQQTDMLALELDPFDEAVQREMAQALLAKGPSRLPEVLRARLQTLWKAACLPAEAMSQGPAEIQAMTLVLMAGRRDGLDPAYGSEMSLALIGRSTGRRVVSLETVSLQLKMLFAQDEAEAESLVQEWVSDLEADRARPVLLKTAQVWESADLVQLENYQAWCECARTESERKLMKKILDDRNPGLALRIHELHGEGRKLFAAVGALHMSGPQGLPALMAARGYKVEYLR